MKTQKEPKQDFDKSKYVSGIDPIVEETPKTYPRKTKTMKTELDKEAVEWLVEMDVLQPNLQTTRPMTEFKQYRRKSISEMRPYVEGEILDGKVSISQADKDNGSPKLGDMIARNPKNHEDQWLVAKQYFEDNLEEI
jgi:hypothetical protein